MSSSSKSGLLSAANVFGFILVVVVNALANALPLNGKTTAEISDSYPTLIAPAGYVFSIWGIIYALLLVFTIYQALPSQRGKPFLQQIGYFFVLGSLANACWIFLWHYELIVPSVLLMFVLLATLIAVYMRLQIGRSKAPFVEKLCVHLPFSVYLGWITVAPIANVAAAVVFLGWDGLGLGEVNWTILVIIIALIITLGVIATRKDIAYSLVVVWAAVGIYVKWTTVAVIPLIFWTALIVAIVVLFAIIVIPLLMRKNPVDYYLVRS